MATSTQRMSKHLVLSHGNLPTRLPVAGTLIAWLLLDRYQPTPWIWLAALVVIGLWWFGALSRALLVEKPIDLFSRPRMLRLLADELREVGELTLRNAGQSVAAPAGVELSEPPARN